MKTAVVVVLSFLMVFCAAPDAHADQVTSWAQSQLKAKGFYYGNVDGVGGPETTASLRRFQIRHGLKVTGTLTEETRIALSDGSAPRTTNDASDLRAPAKDFSERDRDFLGGSDSPGDEVEQDAEPDEPRSGRFGYGRPSVPLPPEPASDDYFDLFRGTRYEDAPPDVQQETLAAAQSRLARFRMYRGAIDGLPGPETERALLIFQDETGLRRTGRLDRDTLDELGISSRRRSQTRFEIEIWPGRHGPVFRGIRVN